MKLGPGFPSEMRMRVQCVLGLLSSVKLLLHALRSSVAYSDQRDVTREKNKQCRY
jgi:hypothetical protein